MNVPDLQDSQTRQFIDQNPSIIRLARAVKEDDGAGGVRKASEKVLVPQRIRMIGLRTPEPRTTDDGRTVIVSRAIVGMRDLIVQIADQFDLDGDRYEVVNVSHDPAWRTTAEIATRG